MNIEEINTTIQELENADTTFANCSKLADLYVIKDHLATDAVITEYQDILPTYHKYCELKAKFQMHELSESIVEEYLQRVCKEINEFLLILYNNTDTQTERQIIRQSIETRFKET